MLEAVKGKLIVSCQALPEEPLHSPFIMGRMALAATQAGASGLRAQGMADILEIKENSDLPIIGIVKRHYDDSEVFITPTQKEIDELIAVLRPGYDMIAIQATVQPRPHGEKLEDLVAYTKAAGFETMADCSTYEECLHAEAIGFDCVGTTLCGYTAYSEVIDGPNIPLIESLVKVLHVPLVAEGKINYPSDLKAVLAAGAYTAVVGSAITRPLEITKRFMKVFDEE